MNALRSAVFGVAGAAQLALAFAVLYAFLREGFKRKMDWLDFWYFSSVTISTLGFGDISPDPSGTPLTFAILRGVIMLELIVGLYFFAAILTTVVSWANASDPWAKPDRKGFPSRRTD